MARAKDEKKRRMILTTSKKLFSKKGFFNTSITDIVNEANLPVGTIYTYFSSKDEIIRIIVDEGWSDLYKRLMKVLASRKSPEEKIRSLVEKFIPEILKDLDLINIILTEAIEYTKIEEKIEKLSELVFNLLNMLPKKTDKKNSNEFSKNTMKTGLVVYFLGVLNTIKLSRLSSINIETTDVIDFLKISIERSMDIDL